LKFLLIIIDGMAYHLFERFIYNLDTFNKLVEEGAYGPLESIYPSITPVALASIVTGLNPKNNGVTGPRIFVKGRTISSPLTAYNSYSLAAEPIWNILGKKGFKITVTSSPQALPDIWKNNNVVLFDPYKAKIKRCSEGIVINEGENEFLNKKWLLKKLGDELQVTLETPTGLVDIKAKPDEWVGPIEILGTCNNRDIKGVVYLHFRTDSVYISPPSFLTNWGNNESLVNEVWEKISKKVGMLLDGDYKSLSKGLISLDEYIKTAELSFNFFYEYSNFILRKTEWNLGITYLPIVDNFQHLFYGIDDSRSLDYIFSAYKMAERFVNSLSDLADNLAIVSDHGIMKAKKRVYINKILQKINVLRIDGNKIDWKRTKAFYAGGGIIRINLAGREEKGIVKKEEYPKLANYIVRNLENYVDPSNNEKIFPIIYEKQTPAGDREGDIELTIAEMYSMSSNTEKDKEIEDVIPYKNSSGDHGYYRKDDLYGIIILYGKNIDHNKKINAKLIDIVPTILKLFNINYNKLDGKPILDAIKNDLHQK